MSVVSKFKECMNLSKKDLLELQSIVEARQLDLDSEKEEALKLVIDQREVVLKKMENKKEEEERIERERLNNYEKNYKDKIDAAKDGQDTLKAIAQVLELREKQKTAARGRLYGLLGVIITLGGIGLSYGSDTFGTLLNKKTMEATKAAIMRFIPKL